MCAVLLATDAVTGTAPVTVRTTYLIAGWVRDWMTKPYSGWLSPQWGAYLQQRSTLSSSPLQAELQEVLGPVTSVDESGS